MGLSSDVLCQDQCVGFGMERDREPRATWIHAHLCPAIPRLLSLVRQPSNQPTVPLQFATVPQLDMQGGGYCFTCDLSAAVSPYTSPSCFDSVVVSSIRWSGVKGVLILVRIGVSSEVSLGQRCDSGRVVIVARIMASSIQDVSKQNNGILIPLSLLRHPPDFTSLTLGPHDKCFLSLTCKRPHPNDRPSSTIEAPTLDTRSMFPGLKAERL
jgi:hypothetical protein